MMSREIHLFNLSGLRITALPSTFIWFVALWIVLAVIAVGLIHLSVGEAIIGALLAAVLHYVGEFIHQYGHSLAARRTGHPMSGVRFWFVLSTSVYPADEGELPGSIHIRRALGGPLLCAAVTILLGIVLLLMGDSRGIWWWLVLVLFLDFLLIFALGALVPIHIGTFTTDGYTILHWWAHR